jgi:hypothetical protein
MAHPQQSEADAPQPGFGLRRAWFFGRVSLLLLAIILAKILVHQRHWELLVPNPLFPALVASEVFLMGFLLNGVLMDYKESEKIPGELAAALECLATEARSVRQRHPEVEVKGALESLAGFGDVLLAWIQHAGPVASLLSRLDAVQLAMERLGVCNAAPLQARLLLELATIRRVVYRIEVIRGTTFVPTSYGMAYIGTALLAGGLLFTDIEPFGESLFFIGAISFQLIKLLLLIADLDNPFSAGQASSVEHVSVMPLVLAVQRLNRIVQDS